jgi:hypothetical protein
MTSLRTIEGLSLKKVEDVLVKMQWIKLSSLPNLIWFRIVFYLLMIIGNNKQREVFS